MFTFAKNPIFSDMNDGIFGKHYTSSFPTFLISNNLERLEFKLKKLLGFRNMQETVFSQKLFKTFRAICNLSKYKNLSDLTSFFLPSF